jgi:hypothetical protein
VRQWSSFLRCGPCVEKLRSVLPFTVGIKDGVVQLVSTLGSVVISAAPGGVGRRYYPNYAEAEPLLWGHDMGREFFVMACNQWPLAAKHYVCPMRDFAFEGQRFDTTQVRA